MAARDAALGAKDWPWPAILVSVVLTISDGIRWTTVATSSSDLAKNCFSSGEVFERL